MARPLTLPESLYVRLPPGTLAALKAEAKVRGVTVQEVARAALLKAVGIRLTPKGRE